MPYVSIIVPTMRVGGLDVLFDSLAKQTFTDFELVLVDALYERRKKIALKESRDRFISLRHVGMDPTPKFCAFSTFSNAGIVSSSGEVLLFLVDYSSLPPDLIEKHARFHQADKTEHRGLMGPHRYVGLDAVTRFPEYGRQEIDRYDADCASGRLDEFLFSLVPGPRPLHGETVKTWPAGGHEADGGAVVPFDADPKLRMQAGPIEPSFFHAKNESVHRDRVIEVNGYDQELDGAHLYQDSDFADRLTIKGGVEWTLDPTAVVEIANPRHLFPFARRVRDHRENYEIWQRKKAGGYVAPPRRMLHENMPKEAQHDAAARAAAELDAVKRLRGPQQLTKMVIDDPGVGRIIEAGAPKTKRIVMIYGEFSSAIHGAFDIDGLYKRVGLTGSESSFFNLARSLCEHGHEVTVFADVLAPATGPAVHESGFNAVPIRHIEKLASLPEINAVIAWNEPDYLRFAPPGVKRLCDQQLNDFGYCRVPGWERLVDQWVSPSENHRQNVMTGLPGSCVVIPNSVDPDLFAGPAPARHPHRVIWCSSPDRGLHHLLGMWPLVRARVPDAELKIFYRLAPWLERVRDLNDEAGRRARYIETVLPRLLPMGVEVVDLVPNERMALELRSAAVLAYPCDPIRYTEGFGCSVLDAAAAGCLPIISDADALPMVHGGAAYVVKGKPGEQRALWADTIAGIANPRDPRWDTAMRSHAEKHARGRVAQQWEALLEAV